jgi:SAM-dependent methyltransferase
MLKKLFRLEYITTRRKLLDDYLQKAEIYMTGRVLDIGGKKIKKRGYFRPPFDKVKSWEYLNIDKKTKPDYCCSAKEIPVNSNSFDTVLLCEILEHIDEPETVIREALRVLKTKGKIIISMPFLFPIHGDPFDYQRFTGDKFRYILKKNKVKILELKRMGYYYSVLSDFILIWIINKKSNFLKRLYLFSFRPLSKILSKFDLKISKGHLSNFTTGFFIIGEKLAS